MSIIDNLFSTQNENIHQDWKELRTEKELETALGLSFEKPVVLFKHSVRCGISAMAKHQVEGDWDLDPKEVAMFYIDLINYRKVSNLIAEKLEVVHQSPQIILVKNGEAVYATSHHMISVKALKDALAA